MTEIQDGTASGLLSFLDWTIDRGELVPVTAASYRTAVRRVLQSEGDPSLIDLRNADLEELLRRFANRRRGDFKEQSLNTYEQRFRNAVLMYLTYLDGGDWRPRRRASRSDSKADSAKRRQTLDADGERREDATSAGHSQVVHGSSAPAMITFPLPIRPGVRGQLVVPEDLTPQEATRISQVIVALAIGTEDSAR